MTEKIIKTIALVNGIIKESEEKIMPIEEPEVVLKHREFEQTQKLLVGLTNELFDKVEKMDSKKKYYNKNTNTIKKTSKNKKKDSSKKKSNFEFTDLTWYKEKLNSKKDEKS